jgi:mannose-6-phosphate isomerase-like protein (cupin superfamily)
MNTKINTHDDKLPWQSLAYYVAARYKELSDISQMIGTQAFYVEIAAGGRILPHSLARPELLFCIEGSGTFSLDDSHSPLEAGDTLYVPRESVRGITNDGESLLRLLAIRPIEEAKVELKDLWRMLWG